MAYNDDNSRLLAIERRDMQATDQFVYSDKQTGIFCRPDCLQSSLPPRSAICLFDTFDQAQQYGYKACTSCKPDSDIKIGKDVIDSTVMAVNASLGLELPSTVVTSGAAAMNVTAPAMLNHTARDDGSNDMRLFCDNHKRSSSSTASPILTGNNSSDGWQPRRASIASGHIPVASMAVNYASMNTNNASSTNSASSTFTPKKREHSRSDSGGDHQRLVDAACFHLARAAHQAAVEAMKESVDSETTASSSSNGRRASGNASVSAGPGKLQRKKRRGGILGFKELAAKAGLSPWHFHRVFRSVTGLTPKAYGEACWNAVTSNPNLPGSIAATASAPMQSSAPKRAPVSTQKRQRVTAPVPPAQAPPVSNTPQQHQQQPFYYLPSNNQQQAQTATPVTTALNSSDAFGTATSASCNNGGLMNENLLGTGSTIPVTTTSMDMVQPMSQTWAPNDDLSDMMAAAVATTISTDVLPPPTLTTESDSAVTTAAFNDLFVTTIGEDGCMTTIAPLSTTSSLDIGGLTTRADDTMANNWLIETPSVDSGDPSMKDPFFQAFTTGADSMPILAFTAGGEWGTDEDLV